MSSPIIRGVLSTRLGKEGIFSSVLYLALDSIMYIHEILCLYATHHHKRSIAANVI
jgi:hypothetical protein